MEEDPENDAKGIDDSDYQFTGPMEGMPCPSLDELESSVVLDACTDLHISKTCGNGKVESGELCFQRSSIPPPFPMDERADESHALGVWLSVADVDDDGAADLVAVFRGTVGQRLMVYWGRADGSFSKPSDIGALGTHAGRPVVVDFDADGKTDIGLVSETQFPIFYGSAKRSFERLGPVIEYDTDHWWEPSERAFVGQFNDDDIADIVLNGGYVLLSHGAREYEQDTLLPEGATIGYIQALADFDGDGARDLLTQLWPTDSKRASMYVLPAFADPIKGSKIRIPNAEKYNDAPFGPGESDMASGIAGIRYRTDPPGSLQLELQTWRITSEGAVQPGFATDVTQLARGRGSAGNGLHSADLDQNGTWDLLFAAGAQPLTDPPMHCEVPSAWRAIHLVLENADGLYIEPKCQPAMSSDPVDLDTGDLNGDGATDIAVMTWSGVELLLSDP